MTQLRIDYVSDLHLSYYIKAHSYGYDKTDMERFIKENIEPKVNGDILVVAGDLSEFTKSAIEFLKLCSAYYDKVIYVAGNHEYYISRVLNSNMKGEYSNSSLNKLKEICTLANSTDKVVFLDRTNENNGITNYNGFLIAGDTFWYLPKSIPGWYFYYMYSNDSRLILSDLSKKEKIQSLHLDSMKWYNNLPQDIDLIITHIPPINNPKKNNSCYFTDIDDFKANYWIYGHDHFEEDFEKDGTRFLSNPWGYNSKDFKIKTLTLRK